LKNISARKLIAALFAVSIIIIVSGIYILLAAGEPNGNDGDVVTSSDMLILSPGDMQVQTPGDMQAQTPSNMLPVTPSDMTADEERNSDREPIAENEPEPESAAENEPAQEQEIMLPAEMQIPIALAQPIDTTSVIVYTGQELKDAIVNNNRYTTIYLGNDITIPDGGIAVTSAKPNFTICGRPPGSADRYTLYDADNNHADQTQTIRVAGFAANITLRDIDLFGRNYYGVVSINDTDLTYGSILTYENATYIGPQMAYCRNATLRLIDFVFTTAKNGSTETQEVAETRFLELGGNVVINKTAPHACFWFLHTTASITVLENANVQINTTLYGFYTDATRLDMTIKQGAALTMTTATGIMNNNMSLTTVTLEENAAFRATRSDSTNYTMLRIGDTLTVGSGATLDLRKSTTDSHPVIRMLNSNARIQFSDPQRVLLYNAAGSGIIVFDHNSGSMSLSAEVINRWSASGTACVDSISNMPANIWHKLDFSLETVTMTTKGSSVTSNVGTDEAWDTSLTSSNFIPGSDRLLVFGRHYLNINTVVEDDTSVSGLSGPNAAVVIEKMQSGSSSQIGAGAADAAGVFNIEVTGDLIAGDTLRFMCNNDFLKFRDFTVVQGRLKFDFVPDQLPFEDTRLSDEAQVVYRKDPNWSITVYDSRVDGGTWSIYASLPDGGLRAPSGSTLDTALVYVDEGGGSTPLSSAGVKVASIAASDTTRTTVSWAANRGLLLFMAPYEGTPEIYSCTIEWTLVDAP